jgi:hypothetical protein
MVIFWIAAAVGLVSAVVYLGLAASEFRRVRGGYISGEAPPESSDEDYRAQRHGFSWVAGIGVVVSLGLLVAASHWSLSWYLLPILSLGG